MGGEPRSCRWDNKYRVHAAMNAYAFNLEQDHKP